MARISTYAIDGTVDNMDKLLGSTGQGTTANFTADVIADYYLRHGGTESSKHGLPFVYGGTIAGLNNIPAQNSGMIYVYDADPDAVVSETFSSITTLVVSTTSNAAEAENAIDIQPILNQYVGEVIKVAGATTTGAKNYALYRVNTVNDNFSYNGLYSLDVEYIEGSSSATTISTADQYNAIILADVAAGDVQLGGLIKDVTVTPNADNNTYTLRIEPQSGDAFVETWTDVSHTILRGSSAPDSNVGADGDFYIQSSGSSRILFGPKLSGNWGTGIELVGSDGDPVESVRVVSGGVNPGDTTVIQFQVAGSDIAVPVTIQPGVAGAAGADGKEINSITVVAGNALRFVFSDGTEITTDPLTFNQVQSDWDATSGAALILNKPTNLTEFSDTESGKVYTWAEGGNTDQIPASKLATSAFETHVFDGTYAQLKAATDNTYADGEIWILGAPASGDSNAYLFVGDPGSGATTDDDWVAFQSAAANLSVTYGSNTVTIVNSAGDNAVLQGAGADAGIMTQADKAKLESIAGGAEVNVQSNWTEGNSASDAFILNKPLTITTDQANNIANSKTITDAIDLNGKSASDKFVFDDYSVVSTNTNDDGAPLDSLTIDGNDFVIEKGSTVTVDGGSQQDIDIIQQTTPVRLDVSDDDELTIIAVTAVGTGTDQTDGLMTHQDKTKLDGIASGAEVNVTPDWGENTSTDPSFIAGKPTLVGASDNPYSGYGFMSAADKEKLDNLSEGGNTVEFSTEEAPAGSMVALSAVLTDDEGNEVNWELGGGTDVVANPGGTGAALATISIAGTTYTIPADQIKVNDVSVSDPNLDDDGIFTWTVSGSNIQFKVAEAALTSSGATHGIISAADAKTLADTITQVSTNTSDISTLKTQVGAINSFDPENAGTEGQVLKRTAASGEYEWQDEDPYDGVTVKHSGDTDVDKVHVLNLIGQGISIVRDTGDTNQVNITITGGGGGTEPITVNAPTFGVDETKFENEDQTPSLTQTWSKESDVTYVESGSQIVITKGSTTVQTRALTSTELAAGTVTFNTSSLDFVTSASDNTIQDVVITTTIKGSTTEDSDITGSHVFTYEFPALQPSITSNVLTNPTGFQKQLLGPGQATEEGVENKCEYWDGGEIDTDFDPPATGWTAGTATVTFDGNSTPPSGWSYVTSGGTGHFTSSDNKVSLEKVVANTVYTQSTVPSGKTAITRTVTTLPSTGFIRNASVRYGFSPAENGGAPTFSDDTANNFGLRKLEDWLGTGRDLAWDAVKPDDAGTLRITNPSNGQYLYFCYDATEADLTEITESGFAKSLTDFTNTTVGDYKCYVSKTPNATSPVAIPYTISNE